MNLRSLAGAILLATLSPVAGHARTLPAGMPRAFASPAPQSDKKDYLTEAEADRIRDADDPNERVKVYLSIALDRLKKFQYELANSANGLRRSETLNNLLNAYSACVDDAADTIGYGVEKGVNIRAGVKQMHTQGNQFLDTLHTLNQGGPEFDLYKETLADAIEATEDAVKGADETSKKISGPPVRRKQ